MFLRGLGPPLLPLFTKVRGETVRKGCVGLAPRPRSSYGAWTARWFPLRFPGSATYEAVKSLEASLIVVGIVGLAENR